MGKTREIRGRIKAVGNIARITKTMQMIATAQLQAAQRRVLASKPYARKISELVGELAGTLAAGGEGKASLSHPLLKGPSPARNRELWLVLTSNRGLCGAYNARVYHLMQEQFRQAGGWQVEVELVGRKGLAMLKYHNRTVRTFHAHFTDKPAYVEVDRLAERYMKEFAAGEFDAVRILYTQFLSVGRQLPTVMQLLPLEDPARKVGAADHTRAVSATYDFSPDPRGLLDELLPITVKTMLFQAFNEAVLSEHIARMVAMKAATDAAKKMGRSLSLRYNRARQASITTELMEVISGAAGLE
jgi:F-type H+-transporting ATPase subunit gamma